MGDGFIDGDAASNLIIGTEGGDFVRGLGGNDTVAGQGGDDTVNGNEGEDSVAGGEGADLVYGGKGSDTIDGGAGDDTVNGNKDQDLVYGGPGADLVYGGQADDRVFGDEGDDTLSGDLGNDTLAGGAGRDVFRFASGQGSDVVLDFDAASGDRLLLGGGLYSVRERNGGVVVEYGDGSSIRLAGVSLADLSSGRIEVLAHRGFAAEAPEESIAAFDHAYAEGARSMEFDIQVTRDDGLVLMHDLTVDRTTNGIGTVKDMTLAGILQLDAGVKFGAAWAGTPVSTAGEIVSWALQHPDTHLYPEVKDYRTLADVGLMLDAFRAAGLEERSTFQSFRLADLRYLRDHGFSGEVMLDVSGQQPDFASTVSALGSLGGRLLIGIDAATLLAHPDYISIARTAGADVAAYTINNSAQVRDLTSEDVHIIFADQFFASPADSAWLGTPEVPAVPLHGPIWTDPLSF